MGDITNLNLTWRSAVFAMLMFPAILCCIALLFRSRERQSILWLVFFIFTVTLTNIPFLIGFSDAYVVWPELTFLPVQFPMFLGPFLYLHAFRLMSNEPYRWRLYLLIPGIISWLYQCWAFLFLGDYQSKWAFTKKYHDPFIVPIETILSVALFLISVFLIIKLQQSYKLWLANNRSDDLKFVPSWLKHFLVFVLIGGMVWVVSLLIDLFFDLSYINEFWPLVFCHFMVLVLALEALSNLHYTYPKLPSVKGTLNPVLDETGKIERDWTTESTALKSAVFTNNWHLEAGFSLNDLAKRYGMNQSYVSRALNQGLGKTFSAFINSLRLEHAKHLLEDSDLKILDVAVSSGFGSKASFNRLFKQNLGLTPSQYRFQKAHN